MTATPPQEAAEFRGKTLTPVSPKPLHFPSPSNIPILDQQTDHSFNVTMMQNMHPNTFPSMAQHTIIPAPAHSVMEEEDATQNPQPQANAPAEGSAVGGDASGISQVLQVQSLEQNGMNSQNYAANQSVPQGTTLSTSSVSSEAAIATSAAGPPLGADNVPSPDDSVDPPASTASQAPMYQSTTNGVELNESQKALNESTLSNPTFDALLASLAQPITAHASSADSTLPPTPSFSNTNGTSPTSALPSNPNLPPKPPAQEKPTHSHYAPGDDIRSYHPHSQKDHVAAIRNPIPVPNLATNGLPPPPHAYQTPMSATIPLHSPALSGYGQRDGTPMSTGEDELPFDRNMQKKFDDFLAFERQNVAEGQWDKFPAGSRLFIGNLPTEKVSKKDVFRKFHSYGDLAQISLKNAFGFVQFLDAATCYRALEGEQGQKLRGREMHLEISKPQKNTRSTIPANHGARRSRSPDYNRGRGQTGPRGVDRYTSGSQVSPRDREFRRTRDDYRPGRSPSPRGGSRGFDRYNDRRRTRSRSPTYGRSNGQRSPSHGAFDDGLQLPRRAPADVPDIQIMVVEDLNIQFIQWVEAQIKSRGLRVDVLILSQRLPEDAVLKRQILEGVQAVVRLARPHEQIGKIPLQVFDRRGGVDNVKYEIYENLDPVTAAEVVRAAKQTHGTPPISYGIPPQSPVTYGIPPTYGRQQAPPPVHYQPPPAQPNISNLLGSLGGPNAPPPTDIARLLQQQTQQGQAAVSPDLARILGQITHPPPLQQSQPPPQHQQSYGQAPPPRPAYPPQYGGAAAAVQHAPPPVQQQQQQQPSAPQPHDISSILAGLTSYKRPD